jgi:hypothetical protein
MATSTETATKWATRVRDWRASGKAAADFAAGKPFAASTLRWWASHAAVAAAKLAPREEIAAVAPRVRMVRVEPAPRATSDALVVTVAGARIEVRTGFDHALLRDVVDALGGAR